MVGVGVTVGVVVGVGVNVVVGVGVMVGVEVHKSGSSTVFFGVGVGAEGVGVLPQAAIKNTMGIQNGKNRFMVKLNPLIQATICSPGCFTFQAPSIENPANLRNTLVRRFATNGSLKRYILIGIRGLTPTVIPIGFPEI